MNNSILIDNILDRIYDLSGIDELKLECTINSISPSDFVSAANDAFGNPMVHTFKDESIIYFPIGTRLHFFKYEDKQWRHIENSSSLVVIGNIDCYMCHLTTLVGCPQVIHGSLYANSNDLTTYDGPRFVRDTVECMHNSKVIQRPDWLTCTHFVNDCTFSQQVIVS